MEIMPFKVVYLDVWNGFQAGLLGQKNGVFLLAFHGFALSLPKRIISRSGSAKENYGEM
jgi:hypothetical protein